MTQAPKIGLVSLGCPKALVDSERIMTTLRSQGYAFSRDYDGADIVLVNTCGFLDSAKKESLEAIGEARRREWPRHRHRLPRRRRRADPRHPSQRARRHRPAPVRGGGQRGEHAFAAGAEQVRRPGAGSGPQADAAALRLHEDFRGLQQPLLVLHHPADPRRPACRARSRRCCTRRSGWWRPASRRSW